MSLNLRKDGYPLLLDKKTLRAIFGVSRWTLNDWLRTRKLAELQWVRLPNGKMGVTRESTQHYIENNMQEI